jgi:hypothetical protein
LFIVRGQPTFEAAALRQGDIIAQIPFLLPDLDKLCVLGGLSHGEPIVVGVPCAPLTPVTHEANADKGWVTVQLPARFGLFAVTSHCCELERRNGRVRTPTLLLSRLRPISNDIRRNAENFASLRANKDSANPNDPGYKEMFYLEAHAELEGHDWVINFNQTITLPTTNFDLLLARKVLQMDDRTRAKFKTKFAFSFGKYTDEEIAAGLDDPWNEPAPAAAAAADVPAAPVAPAADAPAVPAVNQPQAPDN